MSDLHLNSTFAPLTHKELITSNVVGTTVRRCKLSNGTYKSTHNPGVTPEEHGLQLILEDVEILGGRGSGFYTQYHSWVSLRR